ncbi:hypothetical protein MUP01_04090 [Candidatus Bathyarchaeota archaeon]|nr:hypothetical protein [Candidatus Bathyarchaeota archaeon]
MDEAVKYYYLNQKYSSENERQLDMMDKTKVLKRRNQIENGMQSRLNKRIQEAENLCKLSKEQTMIKHAADPEAMKTMQYRMARLWEIVHDGVQVNNIIISENEKERSRYSALDKLKPKDREKAKKEFQKAFKRRIIRLSEVNAELAEAFKTNPIKRSPFEDQKYFTDDHAICTDDPVGMCALPIEEKGRLTIKFKTCSIPFETEVAMA